MLSVLFVNFVDKIKFKIMYTYSAMFFFTNRLFCLGYCISKCKNQLWVLVKTQHEYDGHKHKQPYVPWSGRSNLTGTTPGGTGATLSGGSS